MFEPCRFSVTSTAVMTAIPASATPAASKIVTRTLRFMSPGFLAHAQQMMATSAITKKIPIYAASRASRFNVSIGRPNVASMIS
jgi:hypothetical protein